METPTAEQMSEFRAELIGLLKKIYGPDVEFFILTIQMSEGLQMVVSKRMHPSDLSALFNELATITSVPPDAQAVIGAPS